MSVIYVKIVGSYVKVRFGSPSDTVILECCGSCSLCCLLCHIVIIITLTLLILVRHLRITTQLSTTSSI